MELPNKKYRIIYADPPWQYSNFSGKGTAYGDATAHYNTMSIEELKKLPVQNIADNNCILFMWATYPNLKEALELLESWSFEYKTVAFTWVKTRGGKYYSGLGFYTNSNCEICLIGRKGKFERKHKDVKQLIVSELKEHSKKPSEIRNRIIDLCGDLPRIELFSRDKIEGWDVWGNQLPTDNQTVLHNSPV
jgi:N6-adenosine-specific RNA methylase IME4